jgi:hypothetical protein
MFHCGKSSDFYLLDFDTVLSRKWTPTFRRNVQLPSSVRVGTWRWRQCVSPKVVAANHKTTIWTFIMEAWHRLSGVSSVKCRRPFNISLVIAVDFFMTRRSKEPGDIQYEVTTYAWWSWRQVMSILFCHREWWRPPFSLRSRDNENGRWLIFSRLLEEEKFLKTFLMAVW